MSGRSFDSTASSGSSDFDIQIPPDSHHEPQPQQSRATPGAGTELRPRNFFQFFQNPDFADVKFTFANSDNVVVGHKAIIVAGCPVLRTTLLECGPELRIDKFSCRVFTDCLRGIYANQLPQLSSNASLLYLLDLLAATVEYGLVRFQQYVVSALRLRISTSTVSVIFIRAKELQCDNLKAMCREFLLTLEADPLMSVFQDNRELALEEEDEAALLPTDLVASILMESHAVTVPLVEALHLNRKDVVEKLLALDADPLQRSPDGKLPLQIALERSQDDMVEILIHSAGKRLLNVRAAGASDPMDTLLHVAVRNNNAAHCRLLLKGGADAFEVNSVGQSPLHLAASLASVSMVRLLLQYPVVINQQDENGETCLHMVGQMREPSSKSNAVAAADNHEATMVEAKAARGRQMSDDLVANSEIVTKLLLGVEVDDSIGALTPGLDQPVVHRKFADPEIPCNKGRTPLHTAALHGAFTVVNVLLSFGKRVDITARDYSGNTPLHCAALGASLPCVSLLTQQGASTMCLEQVSHRRGRATSRSPAAAAAGTAAGSNGAGEDVQMVPFIDATNHAGDTALHLAAVACLTSVVKVLLEAGANANIGNAVGYTPMHVWCDQPRVHNEALSEARSGDLHSQALSFGFLSLDGEGQQYTALQAFLDKGAKTSSRTLRGATPLHLAMARGHQEMVVELLKSGADLCAFDNGSRGSQPYTPLTQLRANDSNHHRRATVRGAEQFVMNSPQLAAGMSADFTASTLVDSPTGTPARKAANEIPWTHCVVFQDLVVREGVGFDSKVVGRKIPVGQNVVVAETRGRRARLVQPVVGWASLKRRDDKVLLRPLQDATPVKSSPTAAHLGASSLPSIYCSVPLPSLPRSERLSLERTALNRSELLTHRVFVLSFAVVFSLLCVLSFACSLAQPPVWMPDQAASNCHVCAATYSNFQRRHHCRHCGHIICKSCSPDRLAIPKFKITERVRVCTRCFHVLTRPMDKFDDEDDNLEFTAEEVRESQLRAEAHRERGRSTFVNGSPGKIGADSLRSPQSETTSRRRRSNGDWAAAEVADGAIIRQRKAGDMFDRSGHVRDSVAVSRNRRDRRDDDSPTGNPFDNFEPTTPDDKPAVHNPRLLAHPDDPRAKAFARLDADGDGVVSKEEFVANTEVTASAKLQTKSSGQEYEFSAEDRDRNQQGADRTPTGTPPDSGDFAEAARAPRSPGRSPGGSRHRRKNSNKHKRSKKDRDKRRSRHVARIAD